MKKAETLEPGTCFCGSFVYAVNESTEFKKTLNIPENISFPSPLLRAIRPSGTGVLFPGTRHAWTGFKNTSKENRYKRIMRKRGIAPQRKEKNRDNRCSIDKDKARKSGRVFRDIQGKCPGSLKGRWVHRVLSNRRFQNGIAGAGSG